MPAGRPTKYKEEYCDEIIDFFNRPPYSPILDSEGNPALDKNGQPVMMPSPLPTLAGFAIKLKVHQETVLNWAKTHPEFFEAYKLAKTMQEEILVQNGLAGNYDRVFSIFLAKNITGMKDYKQIEVAAGQNMETNQIQPEAKPLEKKWQIEFINSDKEDK